MEQWTSAWTAEQDTDALLDSLSESTGERACLGIRLFWSEALQCHVTIPED